MIITCRYKMLNPDTKEVLVAIGDNTLLFDSMGYILSGEVEQSYNGRYYLVGYAPHSPTTGELKKLFTDAIQDYLDTTAQSRRYDNIFTAISYVNSTDETFAREAQACLVWRDKVWRKCYDILDAVEAGEREIPTMEELIAELPTIEWNDPIKEENIAEEGGTE